MKSYPPSHPLSRLRHHVSGAIERGEGQAVIERPACPVTRAIVEDTPLPAPAESMQQQVNRANALRRDRWKLAD